MTSYIHMTSYIQQLPIKCVCSLILSDKNVKPILKFISIQEVFISIFNSDSVVKIKTTKIKKRGKLANLF